MENQGQAQNKYEPQQITQIYTRIIGADWNQYQEGRVCIIGKVDGFNNDRIKLIVDLDTNATIEFQWSDDTSALPEFLEVRVVISNGQIELEEYTYLNNDFDLNMYNQMILLTQRDDIRGLFQQIDYQQVM